MSKIDVWSDENLPKIISQFKANHNALRFDLFVQLGRSTGLNPFNKEIQLLSNGTVLIGRDGYRRIAQSHPDYDYHQYDAVYENDDFQIEEGRVKHAYNLKNRGKIIGAYCITKRHKSSKAVYVFVDMIEYNLNQNLWKTKPGTMICKVAEGQCLRSCFTEMFSGTYAEEELPFLEYYKDNNKPDCSKTDELLEILDEKESQEIELYKDKHMTEQQLKKIGSLIMEKSYPEDKIAMAMNYYKVECYLDLDYKAAEHFITRLEKYKCFG